MSAATPERRPFRVPARGAGDGADGLAEAAAPGPHAVRQRWAPCRVARCVRMPAAYACRVCPPHPRAACRACWLTSPRAPQRHAGE